MYVSTKDRIINASIDLISKNGYAETSTRDIAKNVGINTSSIYYHFKSKEDILNYILNLYENVVSEYEHQNQWYEVKDSFIDGIADLSAKEVVDLLVVKFDEQHSVRCGKMVKIICSEAIRNATVSDYLQHRSIDVRFKYIKSVLDTLLEAGKISKCNTAKLAGILYSIIFAFMYLNSIDIQYISEDNESTDMFSLLEYMLKIVLEEFHE